MDDLDNQKCPKCNELYDFETRRTNNGSSGNNYHFRVFERQKHICKHNKQLQQSDMRGSLPLIGTNEWKQCMTALTIMGKRLDEIPNTNELRDEFTAQCIIITEMLKRQ